MKSLDVEEEQKTVAGKRAQPRRSLLACLRGQRLASLLVAACLLGLFSYWLFHNGTDDRAGPTSIKGANKKEKSRATQSRPHLEHAGLADKRIAGLYLEKPMYATREQAELYLARMGRTPDSLATAFYISADRSYLDELSRMGGGDSTLSLSTLAIEKGADRLSCAEKLIDKDPANSFGYLMKFAALVKNGSQDAATQVLSQVQGLQKFSQYDSEKALGEREAWQIIGFGRIEAHVQSSIFSQRVAPGAEVVIQSILESLKPINDDPDENRRIASITPYLKVPLLLAGSSQRATELALFYEAKAEQQILKALPSDVEYGGSGATIEQYLQQKKAELRQMFERTASVKEALRVAPPATIDQYYERVDALGDRAAMEWLLREKK